jgi:hypothetical protein
MEDYGIYTAADANFFPGVVVQINALRLHGYVGTLAVIDTGLDDWMRQYLMERNVTIINLDFLADIRFTDVRSDETAGMRGWSFKAFGIMHSRLFRNFTFMDADYIPLSNPEAELRSRIEAGEFLCTEDGWNTWDERHEEAIGVVPGKYMNINAGFFSASMDHHGAVLQEWRNLMTRRKPFDLWYGDQGALNAILDKYSVPKILVGDKSQWNQTWENEEFARQKVVTIESRSPPVMRFRDGRRIFGWHGCGWHRYWHGIGIDHYRTDTSEIQRMRRECRTKVPKAVLDLFRDLLFHDDDLEISGHLLRCRRWPGGKSRLNFEDVRGALIPEHCRIVCGYIRDHFVGSKRKSLRVVEIGTHYGRTAIAFCTLLPELGFDCHVDTFDIYAPSPDYPEEFATRKEAEENVHRFGLQDRITLHAVEPCEDVRGYLREPPNVVFIDGDHRYKNVLADCVVAHNLLTEGGLVLGDDYQMESVRNAAWDVFGRKQVVELNPSLWAVAVSGAPPVDCNP